MIGIIKSGYSLKLKNFEGPLDLLLELIGGSKLDITEIQLSTVTDQYLNYIKTMQLFNIDIASEFFVMAANLVYIKSRKLIPHLRPDDEEAIDEQELIRRLKEYRIFQKLARHLGNYKEQGDIYYTRGPVRDPMGDGKQYEIKELLLGDLISAVRRYKGAFIRKPIPIKRREVNVEEKMNFIMGLLNAKKMVKFSEITGNDAHKVDKIASFIGTVELSFRQKVLLRQMKLFADIEIERREDIQVVG